MIHYECEDAITLPSTCQMVFGEHAVTADAMHVDGHTLSFRVPAEASLELDTDYTFSVEGCNLNAESTVHVSPSGCCEGR